MYAPSQGFYPASATLHSYFREKQRQLRPSVDELPDCGTKERELLADLHQSRPPRQPTDHRCSDPAVDSFFSYNACCDNVCCYRLRFWVMLLIQSVTELNTSAQFGQFGLRDPAM
ncbi:hypothetical protein ANCDUO_15006 [Ancylostoma duodenale]|uniref:Uncharacterized protein n=1 Tax=Ancylostoma duodenale TaxID=51022 RepID=A0A0C2G1P1_9BILA|nr:hypothetical protein ANCDUO_15006 [Ancylostoma duodenale]